MADDFNVPQSRALAVLPKISGILSCISSGFIIVNILRDPSKRKKTFHRLVCGLSVCDLISSASFGMSTWPIPRDQGYQWAIGTPKTCTAQGFFVQLGISSAFYSAALAIYFLLVIRYGWKDRKILKWEPLLHTIPVLWGTGTAVTGLIVGMFDTATLWCWTNQEYDIFRWIFFYVPLWLCIFIVSATSVAVYLHVRQIDLKAERYKISMHGQDTHETLPNPRSDTSHQPSSDDLESNRELPKRKQSFVSSLRSRMSARKKVMASRKKTRAVANQCFWFAGAFYITWTALSVRYRLMWVYISPLL